jgi:hypothetical protein
VSEWKPAGANGQPSAKELASRHTQTEAPANIPAPSTPARGLPGVSGPGGVRTGSVDAWTRKLRLLDF